MLRRKSSGSENETRMKPRERQRASRRWGIAGSILLLGSFSSSLGLGAEPAAAKRAAQAQRSAAQQAASSLLLRGRAELAQGQPARALDSFSAARDLDESFEAASAIADAKLALGSPLEASASLSAGIERHRGELAPSALAAAQLKLEQLRTSCARLSIASPQADVELELDGAAIGRTPLAGEVVANPGPHQLSAHKPGLRAFTAQLTLSAGARTVSVELSPEVATGRLRVTSQPAEDGVVLQVNQSEVGVLPWEGELPVGLATLSARSKNQERASANVQVEKGVTTSLVLQLVPPSGTLEIDAGSSDTRIAIDGRELAIQHWRGELGVGSHRIDLTRTGFVAQHRVLDVAAGSSATLVVGHWQPLGVRAATVPPKDERGVYVRLDLAAEFGKSSDGVTRHCRAKGSNAGCSSRSPFGGALALRVGYRFGWIAPELFGRGSLVVSYAKARYAHASLPGDDAFYGPVRREDYVFFDYGWAAGAGIRLTSPSPSFLTPSVGLGFGVFSMASRYARTTSATNTIIVNGVSNSVPAAESTTSSVAHSYAPGLVFDVGLLLGQSPGTKLYLGLDIDVEFVAKRAVSAKQSRLGPTPYGTPALDVVSGTQWRAGPVLGFQFGY